MEELSTQADLVADMNDAEEVYGDEIVRRSVLMWLESMEDDVVMNFRDELNIMLSGRGKV